MAVLDPADVTEETYRGGGPGGQHRNTSDTGVRVKHLPSGIEAKVDRGRSWWQNRQEAWAELERRVVADRQRSALADQNETRVAQVGAGDRPSHDWTWCAWRDTVTCHADGRSWPMSRALKGRF
jgi:protein subunit release factor A